MNFEVTIIGANSAVQAFGRFPTCQVLYSNNQPYLIDCGEGSQFRMELFKIKRSKINQIFISHLHGDHYYGLIGFLTTLNLNNRKDPLTIFGPEGIKEILEVNFYYSKTQLKYPLHIEVINAEVHELIFEDNNLEVFSIPLSHKIPTSGFLFREKKRPKNILPDQLKIYEIPKDLIDNIKMGADYVASDGKIIPNEVLTKDSPVPRSYVYCSDTVYTESIIPMIEGANLLYHESTYLEQESHKAAEYYHATAFQAATIADKAKVHQLLLGHFSSRYEHLNQMLSEAQVVFKNTLLSEEGQTYPIE